MDISSLIVINKDFLGTFVYFYKSYTFTSKLGNGCRDFPSIPAFTSTYYQSCLYMTHIGDMDNYDLKNSPAFNSTMWHHLSIISCCMLMSEEERNGDLGPEGNMSSDMHIVFWLMYCVAVYQGWPFIE